MPIKNGYYYPAVNYYNGGSTGSSSTVNATNPQFSGTVLVSGNISASNYNIQGALAASQNYPILAQPQSFYWFDDFIGFYNNALYYPSSQGSYSVTNSQQQSMFNSGAAPNSYGIGALVCGVSAVSGVAGLTLGYNNQLGRFKTFRARGALWLDNYSVAGSESFSASIGIGLHGSGLLTTTRNTVYLSYCDHVSANWRISGKNNGFQIDTGLPMIPNNYYVFDFAMTPTQLNTTNNTGSWALANLTAKTSASGTFVAGAATYYGLAIETGILFGSITKNYGTSTRNMFVDWWEFLGNF